LPDLSDLIAPQTARRPEEVLELVSLALSDGDLEAALAQYERGALLQPWAREAGRDYDSVRDTLIRLMELRLPLSARVAAVLRTGDLALVLGERHMAGTGPGCQPIRLSGLGSTMVRRQPDGAWCIVAEAWCLDEPGTGHTQLTPGPAGATSQVIPPRFP
jgi:ketosteroid isomerase-like protein